MNERLSSTTYLVRRKVFTLAGAAFHFYDAEGRLVLYSKLKAFRLKEDIRLFTGEDMREELLAILERVKPARIAMVDDEVVVSGRLPTADEVRRLLPQG